ncbi:hypothetical protein D3C87_1694480 [compost metagenome]
MLGQLFGPDKLLFAFTPFGDVARDFGKAQQRALVVVDGVDHHVGPEQRAVLAYPPPFSFEAALFAGGGQSALRQARRLVFFAVEAGKVLADYFFLRIALGALRPGVPVGDGAVRMQHVDGVVDDALHKVPVHDVGVVVDHWM